MDNALNEMSITLYLSMHVVGKLHIWFKCSVYVCRCTLLESMLLFGDKD